MELVDLALSMGGTCVCAWNGRQETAMDLAVRSGHADLVGRLAKHPFFTFAKKYVLQAQRLGYDSIVQVLNCTQSKRRKKRS